MFKPLGATDSNNFQRIGKLCNSVKIAVEQIKNWVFVTGEIRGGTTFVGKMLSIPLEVDYIHEPFNIRCGMPGMTKRWRYVKSSLDTKEMNELHEAASRIFKYDFSLRNSPFESDPIHLKMIKRIVGTRGPFYLRLAKMNPFHKHAVIKDPTATLLTEHLYLSFGVKPVIVVRHPLSFIASLKRVDWWPKVGKLLEQEPLLEDYLKEDEAFWKADWSDPIENAAAHWRLLNSVLLEQASRYPDWHVVTLEEISSDPVSRFKRLYENLELPWSDNVERRIVRMTHASNGVEVKNRRVQDLKRDSAQIFNLRKNSLSTKERRKIFEIVEEVALHYYSFESFSLG